MVIYVGTETCPLSSTKKCTSTGLLHVHVMALVFTVTSNIGINLFCTQDIMLIEIGKI